MQDPETRDILLAGLLSVNLREIGILRVNG